MKNLLILVSGSGSNAAAIVNYFEGSDVNIIIACNRKSAKIYDRGLKVPIVDIPSPNNDFSALEKLIRENDFDLVVLAGYMRVIPADILEIMPATINIHPSLLPQFKGSEDGYQDAIDHGVLKTGLTIHCVTEDVDGGPHFLQVEYDIPEEIVRTSEVDNEHAVSLLKDFGLAMEHIFYPVAVKHILFDITLREENLAKELQKAKEVAITQGYTLVNVSINY